MPSRQSWRAPRLRREFFLPLPEVPIYQKFAGVGKVWIDCVHSLKNGHILERNANQPWWCQYSGMLRCCPLACPARGPDARPMWHPISCACEQAALYQPHCCANARRPQQRSSHRASAEHACHVLTPMPAPTTRTRRSGRTRRSAYYFVAPRDACNACSAAPALQWRAVAEPGCFLGSAARSAATR